MTSGAASSECTSITHTALNVPAGSYLISGKASVMNFDGSTQFADCTLNTGDRTLIKLPEGSTDIDQPIMSISVQDAATVGGAPATITMDCHIFSGRIEQIVLTATKVTNVHRQ